MTTSLQKDLAQVKKTAQKIALLTDAQQNKVLRELSAALLKNAKTILSANAKDLAKMDPQDQKYDRLKLDIERIKSIAADLINVTKLPCPIGKTLQTTRRPNGLLIKKISVPLGVIGVIYEARPNVTIDVFSLCFKSGNACVLKGGSDADNSNKALIKIIHEVLKTNGIATNAAHLLSSDREALKAVLNATDYIDVIIPRGGQNLIKFVRENSKIPVIETGAGIVHTYFDESGDLEMGRKIIFNAKTRRPSVCNTLDTLIIHKKRLKDLPKLVEPLAKKEVRIFADDDSYKALKDRYKFLEKATPADFGREFLSLQMAIKTVSNLDQALEHIYVHSSKHSEAIISKDKKNIKKFLATVDAACVYANTSTAFSDGAQFGMGAEIGISTQKIHARGPMALPELTTYKWVITGNGQIRS